MCQRILVPVDGSPFAAQAIPYAALLARRCGGTLTVIRAVELDAAPRSGQTAASTREAAWSEAQRHLAALNVDPLVQGIPFRTHLELGPPAYVVLEAARERAASLIVMATRRHFGASRWSLGSIAGHVLRQTHLPVLLLTPQALAAGGPERLGQPLLIPLDGSAMSEQILPVANALASCLHVPVTLVRAVEADSFAGFPAHSVAPYGVDLERTAREEARRAARLALEAIAWRWRQDDIHASVAVELGDPTAVINDIAGKTRAGWLAMASQGRGGFSGLLFGSTALRVLQYVALPALVTAMPIVAADQRASPPGMLDAS